MHLAGVLRAQLVQPVGRDRVGVGDVIGLAVLDLRDLGLDAEAELLHDRVGEPVRLRVLGPLLEVRVADDLHLLLRRVLNPLVRAGSRGRDVQVLRGRVRRKDVRERDRELVEELGVAFGQVERDRVPVDDDPLRKIASLRRLDAGVATDDDVVPAACIRAVADLEETFERGLDVLARHRVAVRELDAGPERERPRLAVVGRLGNRRREVGNLLGPFRAADPLVADKAVVREDQPLPLLEGVVHLGVRRAGRRCVRERDQRPTLGACSGGRGRRASLALGTAAAAGCQDSDDHSHRPEHRRALQTNHPLSVSRSR